VRVAQGFTAFDLAVAKWVRKDHVTDPEHWMVKTPRPQKLRG
jgi:hypothetical protein